MDTDFLFLSEIKCDTSDLIEAEDSLGEYIVRGNTPDQYITDRTLRIRKAAKNQQSGVAIVTPVQKSPDLSELKSHTHRMQALRLQNDDMNLLMISIYAPTNGDKGKQIEFAKFLRYLSVFIQENRRDSHVIIGGDLNVSPTHKESRRALVKQMMEENNLKIIIPGGPTNVCYNKNSKPSTLDYFMVSEEIEVSDLRILTREKFSENTSTHYPIYAEFHIPKNVSTRGMPEADPTKEGKLDSKSELFVRRRPDWDTLDEILYQKITGEKIKTKMEVMKDDRPDIRLNSILNTSVSSG